MDLQAKLQFDRSPTVIPTPFIVAVFCLQSSPNPLNITRSFSTHSDHAFIYYNLFVIRYNEIEVTFSHPVIFWLNEVNSLYLYIHAGYVAGVHAVTVKIQLPVVVSVIMFRTLISSIF